MLPPFRRSTFRCCRKSQRAARSPASPTGRAMPTYPLAVSTRTTYEIIATIPKSQSEAAATLLYSSGPAPRIRLCLLFHAPSMNHHATANSTDSQAYVNSWPDTTKLGSSPNRTMKAPTTAQDTTSASTTPKRRDVRIRQFASRLKTESPTGSCRWNSEFEACRLSPKGCRVFAVPVDGPADAFFETDRRGPPCSGKFGDVKQLSGSPIGLGGVPFNFTLISNGTRYD